MTSQQCPHLPRRKYRSRDRGSGDPASNAGHRSNGCSGPHNNQGGGDGYHPDVPYRDDWDSSSSSEFGRHHRYKQNDQFLYLWQNGTKNFLLLHVYSIYIVLTAYFTSYLYIIYTLDFTGYIWIVLSGFWKIYREYFMIWA